MTRRKEERMWVTWPLPRCLHTVRKLWAGQGGGGSGVRSNTFNQVGILPM